jgi:hypothetical protein
VDFAPDYPLARQRFLDAARSAGATLTAYPHPLPGLLGERLASDLAWLGPRDARRVLLSLSGTHGVEGLYCSGCQSGWLKGPGLEPLPPDTAVALVHAVNPWGFSWVRRVDADNIDINRNAIDHTTPPPQNHDYRRVHDLLLPAVWDARTADVLKGELARLMGELGPRRVTRAITGGQYEYPDGVFYGGAAASWSCQTLQALVEAHLGFARVIAVLDHHTGLGPQGHTEIICRHEPATPALARARAWWGADVTATALGESESEVIDGNVRMAFQRWCPRALVVAAALEVGTRPGDVVLQALVADNWLHQRGEPLSAQGDAVRALVRDAFYVDTPAWRRRCFDRAMDLYAATLAGLQQEALVP